MSRLDDAARPTLEAIVQQEGHFYYSDYARGYYDRGREEGREEGALAQAVNAVLAVVDARGLEPSSEERARIEECTDLDRLNRWLTRAATATRVGDIFRADS